MRKISKAAVSVALAACAVLGTGAAAHADTITNGVGNSEVDQPTANGYALAYVQWAQNGGPDVSVKNSSTYAYASFVDANTGYTMNGWLERSTNGGASWTTVSGIHTLTSGSELTGQTTDTYYDGPGYLARACFQFTSWSGAAVHCTDWI